MPKVAAYNQYIFDLHYISLVLRTAGIRQETMKDMMRKFKKIGRDIMACTFMIVNINQLQPTIQGSQQSILPQDRPHLSHPYVFWLKRKQIGNGVEIGALKLEYWFSDSRLVKAITTGAA